MRVVSSLADIDFGVGRITRIGGDLVIESSADSTIATKVTITPRDAARSLWALATSPSAWWFVLTLPFRRSGAASAHVASDSGDWQTRRNRIGLNKPW